MFLIYGELDMSMSLHIFSDRPANSMTEWQAAVKADGFDAEFKEDSVFEDVAGFLPVRMFGAGTGFEVYQEDATELANEFSEQGFEVGGAWKCALTFVWGGDLRELIAAYATAASYARMTDGVVFDSEEAKVYQPADVLEIARKMATSLRDQLEPPRYEWDKV